VCAVLRDPHAGPAAHAAPVNPYAAIRAAILSRQAIAMSYVGRTRRVIPVILGRGDGHARLVAFQYGGASSRPLPPDGAWRHFAVDVITDVTLLEDEWCVPSSPSGPQNYVEQIDVAVADY
jgi:predicted DNA-binding transcriptional regulator YafY